MKEAATYPGQSREDVVQDVMDARRAVAAPRREQGAQAETMAHETVDHAKHELGERDRSGGAMARLTSTGV